MTNQNLDQVTDEVEDLLADLEPAEYHAVLKDLAYRRPWRPAHTGWHNVKDQALHMLYAAAVFLPIIFWPTIWGAALSGFLLGALREWEQYTGQDLRIPMLLDRLMDAAFFAVGAALLFAVASAFAG
jgi:hypothetical protein